MVSPIKSSMLTRSGLVVGVAMLLFAGADRARAAMIGTYPFTSSSVTVSSPATGVTFSNYARGAGATAETSTTTFVSSGFNASTLALAVTNNDYVGFTITPTAGYRYTITSFGYDYGIDSSGPTTVLETSRGGFGSGTSLGTLSAGTGRSISLSGYTNLTTATELRLYGYSASNASKKSWEDNVLLNGDTQARASLSAAVAANPPARTMLNTANVRFTVNVTNDALAAGTASTQNLDYTMSLNGGTGLSLSASGGTGLGSGAQGTQYVNVNTSTTGLKGGGSLTVAGTDVWRANGTVGATQASFNLSSVAVVDKRTVTADNLTLGGKYLEGALLDNLGAQSLTLRSTGSDNSYTRVTAAGNLFDTTETFNTTATGSGAIGHSGTFTTYPVTGEGLAGEGSYGNVTVGYTAAVVGNAQANQSGLTSVFGDPLTAIVTPSGSLAGLQSQALEAINTGPNGAPLVQSTARILSGTNSSGMDEVRMAWRTRTIAEAAPVGGTGSPLLADVVNLQGISTDDVYVLQMTYDDSVLASLGGKTTLAQAGLIQLAWLNNSDVWVNAIDGNASTNTGSENLQGSWSGVGHPMDLGTWGVDTANNLVWAVVDHGGQFGVGLVPEPATFIFLVLGGFGILFSRNRPRP